MVRARESHASIRQQVENRKLLAKLSPEQEAKLKSQGASESLLKSLRSPDLVLSAAAAAEFTAATSKAPAQARATDSSARDPNVHVLNVGYGHSINLSFWGGPDYEVAFQSYRYAGEDRVQAVLIDPVCTMVDERTYLGDGRRFDRFTEDGYRSDRLTPYLGGDLKNDEISRSHFTSVSARRVTRVLEIDHRNPVRLEGVPYNLYRVYGAGGVGLYFIGVNGGSVTIAISSAAH